MVRTRGGKNNAARQNIFSNWGFAAAKEIANAHRRNYQIKNKFLLPLSKRVQVKRIGNVVREITVRTRAVYPTQHRNVEH